MTIGRVLQGTPPRRALPAIPQPPPFLPATRTSSSLPLKPRQDSQPSPFSDILTRFPDRSSRAKRLTPSTWRQPPPPSLFLSPTRPCGAGSAGKLSPRIARCRAVTAIKNYKTQKPRCQGAPANGEAAARAVAPPRRARGVMSLPSGGRGAAPRAAAHCARPVPRPGSAGGPRSRCCCAACGGRPRSHPAHRCLAPSPAAPVPGVLAPGWLGSVPEGCAVLRCTGGGDLTRIPERDCLLRPAPLHPSWGAALRREGGQHPSQWKWAASRSSPGCAARPACGGCSAQPRCARRAAAARGCRFCPASPTGSWLPPRFMVVEREDKSQTR